MSDTLECVARSSTGSREARRLRRQGMVPAILYGHGEACVPLAASREAVEAAVRHGSRIVELKGAVKTSALVREMQWDTFGVEPLHVDFIRVSASDRVRVKVPIDLKGESPGQRSGGILTLVLHEMEIECRADAIPDKLHAMVAHLDIGGVIKVHDLELPAGAKVLAEPEEVVVTCVKPVEKGAEAAVAAAEPEVIGRKASEEGEGAEAGKE